MRFKTDATHDNDSSKVKERRKNNEFYADLWNAGGAFSLAKKQSDSSHKDDSLNHDKEASASASVSEDHEASTTINKMLVMMVRVSSKLKETIYLVVAKLSVAAKIP